MFAFVSARTLFAALGSVLIAATTVAAAVGPAVTGLVA